MLFGFGAVSRLPGRRRRKKKEEEEERRKKNEPNLYLSTTKKVSYAKKDKIFVTSVEFAQIFLIQKNHYSGYDQPIVPLRKANPFLPVLNGSPFIKIIPTKVTKSLYSIQTNIWAVVYRNLRLK